MRHWVTVCFLSASLLGLASRRAEADNPICPGDCDGNGRVTVDELTVAIPLLFGDGEIQSCSALDADASGKITVNELMLPLVAALEGCPVSPTACNGKDELCERRYDQVAYPTAHNAMANADEGWMSPNQQHDVSRQLHEGIRSLMLDTYHYRDDIYVCHADCDFFGHKRLADSLAEITAFIERRPREVVTIIFEAYVSAADSEPAFIESGLLDYLHVQLLNQPWPTLEEMIDSGKRVVVFADNDRRARPWYHYVWDYAFETNFSFEKPEDFSCTPNRGNPTHSLFILNHFLTRGVGHPKLAKQVNFNPLFIDRALQCMVDNDRLPNFVTVDFYDIGDVFDVVDELNAASTPVR